MNSKGYFYIVLSILSALLFFMAQDAPVDVDELLHNGQARKVVQWYISGGQDSSCLDTPRSFLKYYGQSMDNLGASINYAFSLEDEYYTRHLLGFVIGVLLLLVTGLITVEVSGSYWLAIGAILLLFFSPRPMGQIIDNLKDLPFALGYAWCILWVLRLVKQLPEVKWKTALYLGIAIAFSSSVRIGAMVFFPYLAVVLCAWYLNYYKQYHNILKRRQFWKSLLLKGGICVVIAYFGGLLFWPYGLIKPLYNPLQSLLLMQRYAVSIRQLFEGEIFWSTSLPWYYLLKWLWISIPEVLWLGLILGPIAGFLRWLKTGKKEGFFTWILLFFALFPVVYVIAINANLYSGWRQLYFVYVPLLVLSVSGFYTTWQVLKFRHKTVFVCICFGLGLLLPAKHMLKTAPLHYIYFNAMSGGSNNAWNKYEYDYYWMGIKEASDALKNIMEDPKGKIIASNFDLHPYFFNWDVDLKYVRFYERENLNWDYAILGVNYINPEQFKHHTWMPGGVIKTVSHLGHPIAVVLKRQNKACLRANDLVLAKEYISAISLYDKVLDVDPHNMDVIARKAACFLELKRWDEFKATITHGMTMNRAYEPFYLLLARQEFMQQNYRETIKISENLLKMNKRYTQILPLLKEAYYMVDEIDKAKKIEVFLEKNKLTINF